MSTSASPPVPTTAPSGLSGWAGGLLVAVAFWPAIVLALLGPWSGEAFFASFDPPKRVVLVGGAAFLTLLAARRLPREREWVLADPRVALALVVALAALLAGAFAGVRGSIGGPIVALSALLAARVVARGDGMAAAYGVARGAALATVCAALYAIAQVTGLDSTELTREGAAPGSFFGNPSFAGEFLAAAIPLATVLAIRPARPRLDRVLGALAVVLGLTHLVLTRSRIDFVALAAAASVAAVVCLFARRGGRPLAWAVTTTLALAGAAVAFAFLAATFGDGASWIGRSDTLAVRSGIWGDTGRLVLDRPFGLAGAPFIDLYPPWRSAAEYQLSHGRVVDTAHNDWLGLAVSVGLPGLLLSLGALALVVSGLIAGPRETLPVRTALLASLTAVCVSACASAPLSHPTTALLPALVAGAAIALVPGTRRPLPIPARAVDVGAGLLLALCLWPGPVLGDARTDAFLGSARRSLGAGDGEAALAWLERAAAQSPETFEIAYELGSIYASQGRHDVAIPELERAHAIQPGSMECRVNLANSLRAAGRRQDAVRLVDESLALCAWHPLLLTTRAALAMDDDDPRKALDCLLAAEPLLPSEPRIAARRIEVELALTRAERGLPDYAAATSVLDHMLAIDDRRGAADAVAGFLARDPGVRESLLRWLSERAKEHPGFVLVLLDAADRAGLAEDPDFLLDASRIARKAGDGENATHLNGRSWGIQARGLARKGRDAEALRAAEKAAARAPSTEHFLLVAQILAKQDQQRAAVRAVGQALALGDFHPDAVRKDPTLAGLLPDEELEQILTVAEQRLR